MSHVNMLHRMDDFKDALGASYRSCNEKLAVLFGLYIIYVSLPLFPFSVITVRTLMKLNEAHKPSHPS